MRLTRGRAATALVVVVTAVLSGQAPAAARTAGRRVHAEPAAAGPPVYTEAPHTGDYYGSTSTTSPGGGIYEDMALNTSAGQLVCASAWLRTQFPAIGATGDFALWLRGDTTPDGGRTQYSGLANLGDWTEVQTCVEATGDHNSLRVQFYPNPGSPTVDMDDVDVHESLAANGGFETGAGAPWQAEPDTDFVVDQGSAHSGSWFAATSSLGAGAGIYQDVSLTTTPGQLVCGSAWLRNQGSVPAAAGTFELWLRGETAIDNGFANYNLTGSGSNWTEVQTCVEATGDHNSLRIQFYPNGHTVDIDDVDVHVSLAANGGFEDGAGPWSAYPGTNSAYAVDKSALVYGPLPPVVTTPVTTPLPRPRGRHRLKVRVALSWTWRYRVTRLDKVKLGRFPRGTRLSFQCLGRGCPRPAIASAAGRRRMQRLLRAWTGRRFRAGDRLRVTLTAPGYRAQRATVLIRFGKIPLVKSL